MNSLLPKWWGGYSVFQLEKSKFVKKKVEETTSFVPGEEKEAVTTVRGKGGGGGGLRLAPVRHDLYSCYSCAFDLERIWQN